MSTKRLADALRTWLFTFVIVMACATAARADETSWIHSPPSLGDWFDLANWSNGVPGIQWNTYIDNGGTAQIASGTASCARLFVGLDNSGAVQQTGGRNDLGYGYGGVYLGFNEGSSGTYELGGDGYISTAGRLYIGYGGTGLLRQTGGGIWGPLYIGTEATGIGTYELVAGNLRHDWGMVGVRGTGVVQQSGGELITYSGYGNFHIGYYNGSHGTYRQSGGLHIVGAPHYDNLVMGYEAGAVGRYELSGTGELEAENILVGSSGQGEFIQTGGTNTVEEDLYLGYSAGAEGTYELSGGTVSTDNIYVGYEGTGSFKQSGGLNAFNYCNVSNLGTYEFTGGTVQDGRRWDVRGTLDFVDSSATLNVPTGMILDVTGGSIAKSSHASMTGEGNTLIIFPAGFDPSTQLAGYSSNGVTHVAGATLVVPAGRGFVGSGTIEDHVHCHGTISKPAHGPALTLTSGLEVFAGGSVDMKALTVDDICSGISGGTLNSESVCVGRTGTGRFEQTSGTTWVSDGLKCGDEAGSEGTYQIAGGGPDGQ